MPPRCAAQHVTRAPFSSRPGDAREDPGVAKLKAALKRLDGSLIQRECRLRNDAQRTCRGLPIESLDDHILEAHPLPGQRKLKFVKRLLGREEERGLPAPLPRWESCEPLDLAERADLRPQILMHGVDDFAIEAEPPHVAIARDD